MELEAVFFDFDGVICDSVSIKTEAFAKMYSKYGKEIEEKVVQFHLSNCGLSRYEKFKFWNLEFFNYELSQNQLNKLDMIFSKLVFEKVMESDYIPGAIETLHSLKSKNIATFIVSATPDIEIKNIVINRDLVSLFDEVHGSPSSKDTILKDIIFRKKYHPNNCLFVGDAMADLKAAEANGIEFFGIINSNNSNIFQSNTLVSRTVDLTLLQNKYLNLKTLP